MPSPTTDLDRPIEINGTPYLASCIWESPEGEAYDRLTWLARVDTYQDGRTEYVDIKPELLGDDIDHVWDALAQEREADRA